ncbi:aldo/keto reductase [Dictyobacter formicarum]|uniref:Oxidoreductase n=1 Tax=Dictyobacter formicarum TaxID=2778368 RepID=A0ABQ3VFN5_9CHLR|nr:aldo/keto reductase [Dictyobacter formicarum]GHO84805.1 oxidoreductase [Dictyobacter formicarum]
MTQTLKRTLGKSKLSVSALGLGCWAIGGEFTIDGRPAGWGNVDDAESMHAIQRALELGITFFDTADVYGCGHSERILGQALAGRRNAVVIATKFGNVFDEQTRQGAGRNLTPEYIRSACEASLKRLNTDYIDLYEMHSTPETMTETEDVLATLEELVSAGKIRYYGPSTDDVEVARSFARAPHYTAVQQQLNVFGGNDELIAYCEAENLAVICRTPLAMGMLTGKYQDENALAANDVRRHTPWWEYFKAGRMQEWVARVEVLRDILSSDGRTLTQGALGWIWARSNQALPIPGFKTVAQVEENAAALRLGALSQQQMQQIDTLLKSTF